MICCISSFRSIQSLASWKSSLTWSLGLGAQGYWNVGKVSPISSPGETSGSEQRTDTFLPAITGRGGKLTCKVSEHLPSLFLTSKINDVLTYEHNSSSMSALRSVTSPSYTVVWFWERINKYIGSLGSFLTNSAARMSD